MRNALIIILFSMLGCGKTKSPYDEGPPQKFTLKQSGYYRAPFKALNQRVGGSIKGRASFFINEFQFYAKVNLSTAWSEVTHLQMVHAGSECPQKSDDLNKDGYIDGLEAISRVGNVLIPLDYGLESQFEQFSVYPVSNFKGKYVYGQSVSTSSMMNDLRQKDHEPMDFLGKLAPSEEIKLNEKVVVIYGVPEEKRLPSSVEGFQGFPSNLALPIACAEIKVTSEVFP